MSLREAAVRYASELGWSVYCDHWVKAPSAEQVALYLSLREEHEWPEDVPALVCSCGWIRSPKKEGERYSLCDSPGKHPYAKLAPNGPLSASSSAKVIEGWWSTAARAHIAIATGQKSGIWVLDIDVKSGGLESLAKLLAAQGIASAETEAPSPGSYNSPPSPPEGRGSVDLVEAACSYFGTAVARTGGGGLHIFFRWQSAVKGKNLAGAFDLWDLPGIDIRSDNGHVVGAPSGHASGRRYEWIREPWGAPMWGPLAYSHLAAPEERVEGALRLAPAWLIEMIEDPRCGKKQSGGGVSLGMTSGAGAGYELPELIPWGQQDDELVRYAGHLRGKGWDFEPIMEALVLAVAERCQQPSKSKADCRRIARSICKKPKGVGFEKPPPIGQPVPASVVEEIKKVAPKREPRGGSREYARVVSQVASADTEAPSPGSYNSPPSPLSGRGLVDPSPSADAVVDPYEDEPDGLFDIAQANTREEGTPPPEAPIGYVTSEEEEPRRFELTEYGTAERLIDAASGDFRYCHLFGKWLTWDGVRWSTDETGGAPVQQKLIGVMRDLKESARKIRGPVENAAGKKTYKGQLLDWAGKCETRARFSAITDLAKRLPSVSVTPDDLDGDHWLLGVKNGTIDLRTGQLREARREDLMTKQAGCSYDPEAECPEFESFFRWAMRGDKELMRFVLLALGYSLTGEVNEEIFFFLHGSGGNGKGTLSGLMQTMLGDYQGTLRKDCLMAKQVTEVPNDIAALKGKRMVWVHEVPDKAFDEALLKTLTGRDDITARFFREEWFTFMPTFKLWITGNVRPAIRQFDAAMVRRLREVPFAAKAGEEEKAAFKTRHGKDIKQKLIDDEMPGVLRLLVRYCSHWRVDGLPVPTAVGEASEEYRTYMDRIGAFFDAECEMDDPTIETGGQALYDRYRSYCKRSGETFCYPLRQFGEKLKDRLESRRTARGVMYKGISLRALEGGDV